MKINNLKGVLFCLGAAVIWGISFPVMGKILQQMDAFSMTAFRYFTALPLFILLLIKTEGTKSFNIGKENKLLLAFFSISGFVGFGFFVGIGQKMAGAEGALNASIINATMPILGLMINYFIKKSPRPSISSLICILFSFIGVLLVITKGRIAHLFDSPQDFAADLLILLGALGWVTYTIGVQYYPNWSSIKYTTITSIFGVMAILFFESILFSAKIMILPNLDQISAVAGELLYLGFISSFAGVLFWNIGNKILTPINGVLFINAVPITAFIYSAFHGITAQPIQIIGVAITIIALIFNNLLQRRKNKI